LREGKGQKCKGLSFDSKVHADPEAVMHIQGHTPFKARGGLGGAGYGLDMV